MLAHRRLRPAAREELRLVWPAARTAHLFEDERGLEMFWEQGAWRVMVAGRREAAVVDAWRAGGDILAVRGLWCAERRVPELVLQLRSAATAQGFRRLLSPPVPEGASRGYRRAGMRECERLLAMCFDDPQRRPAPDLTPEGVTLRVGSIADMGPVLDVDAACFDDFWRYDIPTLTAYLGSERLALAEFGSEVVGYTLSTVRAGSGTLGRLAVAPAWRGRGIGLALVLDAVSYLGRVGAAHVTLSTQEHNAVSRRLYARAGFREIAGRLLFLMSDRLE